MGRQATGRRESKTLIARLDCDVDADLIAWCESLPVGKRSQILRDTLRKGIKASATSEENINIVAVIKHAIADALKGVHSMAAEQGVNLDTNDIEETFGGQLDELLGKF
jgi:hypothetical protein